MILFFLNILFFNFWEKSDVEREIIEENFGNNEMWKRNNMRKILKKKKQVRETIKKCGNKILREIVGEKKDMGENLGK